MFISVPNIVLDTITIRRQTKNSSHILQRPPESNSATFKTEKAISSETSKQITLHDVINQKVTTSS